MQKATAPSGLMLVMLCFSLMRAHHLCIWFFNIPSVFVISLSLLCVYRVRNQITFLFGCWTLHIWRTTVWKFDSPLRKETLHRIKSPKDFKFRSLVQLNFWRFKTFYGCKVDAWMEMKENPRAYLRNLSLFIWYSSVCTMIFHSDGRGG